MKYSSLPYKIVIYELIHLQTDQRKIYFIFNFKKIFIDPAREAICHIISFKRGITFHLKFGLQRNRSKLFF